MKKIHKLCPNIVHPSGEYYKVPVEFDYDHSFRYRRDYILKKLFEGNKIINTSSISILKYGPKLKLDLQDHERWMSQEWKEFIQERKQENGLGIFFTEYSFEGDNFKNGETRIDDRHGHAVVCMVDFRPDKSGKIRNKLYIFDPNGDKNTTINSEATSSVTVRGRRGRNVDVDPGSVNTGLRLVESIRYNFQSAVNEEVFVTYSLRMKAFNISEDSDTMRRDAELGIQQTVSERPWGKCAVFSIAFLVYIFCAKNSSSAMFDEMYEAITNGVSSRKERKYNLLMFARAFMFNIVSLTYDTDSDNYPLLNSKVIKYKPYGSGVRTKLSRIPVKPKRHSHLPSSPPPPPPPPPPP